MAYARPRYSPFSVETLIFSPSLMKSGTVMFFPVSSLAAFCTLFALSPFTPSADSATVRMTVDGSSTFAA